MKQLINLLCLSTFFILVLNGLVAVYTSQLEDRIERLEKHCEAADTVDDVCVLNDNVLIIGNSEQVSAN